MSKQSSHSLLHTITVSYKLSFSDLEARYARSTFGPFWITLGNLIGIVGLGFVSSALFGMPRTEFIPRLTFGLISWQFVSSVLSDASNVFVRAAGMMRNTVMDPKIPVFLSFFQYFFTFLHNLPLLLVALCYGHHFDLLGWGLTCLGFFLLLVTLLSLTFLFGMIGVRYRDFMPLVNSLLPIVFFLSPVVYPIERLGKLQQVMYLNPFVHYLGLTRGIFVIPDDWKVNVLGASLVTCFSVGLSWYFWIKKKSRLVFYL